MIEGWFACLCVKEIGNRAGLLVRRPTVMVVIIIDYIVLDDYYQMDFIILSFNYPSTSADSSKPSSSVVHASMLYFFKSDLSINGFGRKLNSDADVWKLI